ncbi:MAG: thioesterase family protein [Owenweeksia sp.]|nr:thioesterase family protein [Owenweeksia sp.]
MYNNNSSLRVRYAETDQMAVVYYGNYPQYFEVGRVEALRSLGMSYRKMEEQGLILPVFHLEIKYHKPALYDDNLKILTQIRELPTTRITFHHEIYNESNHLLTSGSVQLVFVDKTSRRPRRCPADLTERLRGFFKGESE